MLISLLNWIYIFVTTYVTGAFLLPRIARFIDPDSNPRFNRYDYVVAGIVITTVYAELFSLFYKVGLLANIIMILCCIAFVCVDRARIREIMADRRRLPDGAIAKTGYCLLTLFSIAVIFITLMFTAGSAFHYDTGLYHAQAIHWIEDFGIVKGLGLIHAKFAYNSAYFPLCALYSLRDITPGGQSLHSVSGFIFAVMCAYSFYGWKDALIRKTPGAGRTFAVSSCIRMAALFYLSICLLEITSPETDYIACNLIIWSFLRFCEIHENEKEGDGLVGYCLVSICSFAIVGYKLSVGVIPLIAIWPLVMMVRKKRWRSIGACTLLCVITVFPFLARNIMICGWPVYPVAILDLIDVPWKFDVEMLKGEAKQIKEWAHGMNGAVAWWEKQLFVTRMFLSSMLMSLLLAFVALFNRKRRLIGFLALVAIASLVFYWREAPTIRYCYGPVLVLPLMLVGCLMDIMLQRSVIQLLSAVIISVLIVYPSVVGTKEQIVIDCEGSDLNFDNSGILISQVDYPKADVNEINWCGYKVYYPKDGDQCWYHAFPSSPYKESFNSIEPVSGNLSDGIRIKSEK